MLQNVCVEVALKPAVTDVFISEVTPLTIQRRSVITNCLVLEHSHLL